MLWISMHISLCATLEKNMVLTAEQLAVLVFSTGNERTSLNIAQKRLRTLYTKKQIKRYRNHTNEPDILELKLTILEIQISLENFKRSLSSQKKNSKNRKIC